MKKMIYSFALITALTVVSTANALSGGGQQYEKPVTSFKKACEVCPYYDEEMCRNWTPDCREELDPPFNPPRADPPIINPPYNPPASTATVSSCPAGTTKSSDGCCCVNN